MEQIQENNQGKQNREIHAAAMDDLGFVMHWSSDVKEHGGSGPSFAWTMVKCRMCEKSLSFYNIENRTHVEDMVNAARDHLMNQCPWETKEPEKIVMITGSEGTTCVAWHELKVTERAGVVALAELANGRSGDYAPAIYVVEKNSPQYRFTRWRWLKDLFRSELRREFEMGTDYDEGSLTQRLAELG